MQRTLKRIGILLAVGGVLGDIVAMLIGPGMLAWYQTPGLGQALCNCKDTAAQTAAYFVRVQLIATAIGAVTVLVVGEILRHLWLARQRRRAAATAPAPAAPLLPK